MPPRNDSSRSESTSRPPRRKNSGGGMGVIFAVMAVVVLAVIVTAFVVGGDGGAKKKPVNADGPQYVSVKPKKNWPVVEPWNGLAVGQTRDQVIAKFGNPNTEDANFSLGFEKLEWHKEAGQGGVFTDTGGSKLSVFIDLETKKVVYFIPPGTIIRSNP